MTLRINEVYAYIAVDEDGNEGITGFRGPDGWMPMVGADKERMMSLRSMATTIAGLSGKEVKLVRFTTRIEIETLKDLPPLEHEDL